MTFQNPLIAAAGKWAWTAEDWKALAEGGAGGITTKSFWNHEHQGNPEPTVVQTPDWTLNAVGLPDKGPEHSEGELKKFLPNPPVPLIVSILGMTPEEYADNAKRIVVLKPSALEINLSSPTFLKLKGRGYNVDEAKDIITAVKKVAGSTPIFVKLSPNIEGIGVFAAACVSAGADGITAINTLGTGIALDLKTRKPLLSAGKGGLSGPAIKPLAVRCISEIYQATGGKVPIIGIGGVVTGEDAVELMMAGASLVGLATAILREGPACFGRILQEMETWARKEKIEEISTLNP